MYIHALRGGLIALIVFIILVFTVPGVGLSDEINMLLTASTFLFAILSGFLIARMNSRYDKIKENVSNEDSGYIQLYKLVEINNKNLLKKLIELIDRSYIMFYDFWITSEAYIKERDTTYKIYDLFRKSMGRSEEIYSEILVQLDEIEASSKMNQNLLEENVSKGQWVVLLSLVFVIIFCLFYMNTAIVYHVTTVILSTTLVMILLLVRDLSNLMLGGQLLLIESGQEIFEHLGKPRYYNHVHIKSGMIKVPDYVKEYRLGLHKPGEKLNIKLVKNEKYNPDI